MTINESRKSIKKPLSAPRQTCRPTSTPTHTSILIWQIGHLCLFSDASFTKILTENSSYILLPVGTQDSVSPVNSVDHLSESVCRSHPAPHPSEHPPTPSRRCPTSLKDSSYRAVLPSTFSLQHSLDKVSWKLAREKCACIQTFACLHK